MRYPNIYSSTQVLGRRFTYLPPPRPHPAPPPPGLIKPKSNNYYQYKTGSTFISTCSCGETQVIDFIQSCLLFDPERRPTLETLRNHPWITA